MNDQSFTTTFSVDQTPEAAFEAIKNVRGWWSEGIEGSTEKPGDEFTYRHKKIHYSRQKLLEVVPGRKLVWLVLNDAYLSFTKDSNEWNGSQLCFELSRKRDKTEVRFTHRGLVEEHECYDACVGGWTFYIQESLQALIATGKGQPDRKEKRRRARTAR